jgi:hypothetical protein
MPKKLRPAVDLMAFKFRTLKIKRSLEDLGENGGRMLTCGMKSWDGFDSLMIASILIALMKLHVL